MNYSKKTGFTLVELIVAIAVIAILASISLVAYIGAKERAREEKAATNAQLVKKVAESYYSRNNIYPNTSAQFRSATVSLPSEILLMSTSNPTLNATTGETLVAYKYVPNSSSNPTGACIYYWDFSANTVSAITYLGTATSGNCSTASGVGSTPAP